MSNPNPKTEHLEATKFQPGHAPLAGGGRPKKNVITDSARYYLEEPHPKWPGMTRGQVIGLKWVRRAEKDMKDLAPLLDRMEGKTVDPEPVSDGDDDVFAEIEKDLAKRISESPASGHIGPLPE